MKTMMVFYLACLAVLAFVCIFMYRTTNYYAVAYPYSSITALPHNSTTVILSVFNGYSERVPQNANLTNIGSVRQGALQGVTSTIEELLLAFVTLMMFSVFSVILKKRREVDANQSKRLYFIPVIFLVALLVSQYLIAFAFVLQHKTSSGISFFFVDSLATIIWFGILDELFLYQYIKKASSAIAFKVLGVLWPPTLILITVMLLQNLGLLAYNAGFAATYIVHFEGIVEFAIVFGALFYYKDSRMPITRILHFKK